MSILTIDPERPALIVGLAGYLGRASVINARIKGGGKAIAKVLIYLELFDDEGGYYVPADSWTYKQAVGPESKVGLMWSYPPDDPEADTPNPADWREYADGEVVRDINDMGQGSVWDSSVNSWRSWQMGPVYLEDKAFGLVDSEELDLDWSDVIGFLRQKGIKPS